MLAAAGAAAIWGGTYVVSKVVLEVVPPFTLVALRLAVAAVLFGAVVALGRSDPPRRRDVPRLLFAGVVGFGLSLGAQFAGTRLSTAHDGALITCATPAFIAVFAGPLLRERVSPRRWLATGLATAGVLFVAAGSTAPDATAPHPVTGNALLLIAAVTWALYTVLAKASMASASPLTVSFYATLGGLLAMAPAVAAEGVLEGFPDWAALSPGVWLGILYLGAVSTAVAFYLWNRAFETLDAAVGALLFFVQPVVGALLGWLLLGERLPPAFFLGGAAIAVGVLLAAGETEARAATPAGRRG